MTCSYEVYPSQSRLISHLSSSDCLMWLTLSSSNFFSGTYFPIRGVILILILHYPTPTPSTPGTLPPKSGPGTKKTAGAVEKASDHTRSGRINTLRPIHGGSSVSNGVIIVQRLSLRLETAEPRWRTALSLFEVFQGQGLLIAVLVCQTYLAQRKQVCC